MVAERWVPAQPRPAIGRSLCRCYEVSRTAPKVPCRLHGGGVAGGNQRPRQLDAAVPADRPHRSMLPAVTPSTVSVESPGCGFLHDELRFS